MRTEEDEERERRGGDWDEGNIGKERRGRKRKEEEEERNIGRGGEIDWE